MLENAYRCGKYIATFCFEVQQPPCVFDRHFADVERSCVAVVCHFGRPVQSESE